MNFDILWEVKYRPYKFEDIILTPEVREYFLNVQKTKNIPNILLVGEPGGGKSRLGHIIVNDLLGCQYLYINASDESGIETVRGKITNFIQTKSIDGGIKVVFLDEFDGFSTAGQDALRNSIEEYAKYARFVLTANNINKISDAIRSRCSAGTFYIQPSRSEYSNRLIKILHEEKIRIDKDQIENFKKLINDCYPDLRAGINSLQKFSITGKFIYAEVDLTKEVAQLAKTCYDYIRNKKDIFEMRGAVIAKETAFNSNYQALLRQLFDLFYADADLPMTKKKIVLLVISDSMCADATVLDKEINFFACVIKIEQILDK
jgi:DNA polymerase III delta prime subunit